MPQSDQESWYALYVRSQQEKSVLSQLDARGYEGFLPLYSTKRKWSDRWKTIELPLFPGYVFCRFDPATRSSVLGAPGVVDIVRAGPAPAAIETSEIDAIKLAAGSPLFAEPYANLVTGQRVTIKSGPLTGVEGTLTKVRENLRLVLSIQLLNRSIAVEIERDWIVPYDCPPYRTESVRQ